MEQHQFYETLKFLEADGIFSENIRNQIEKNRLFVLSPSDDTCRKRTFFDFSSVFQYVLILFQ